jgi:hypothetical protein
MGRGYEAGLQEVGDGLYACLQPDRGWGCSSAGLVSDGERSLLIDTLFDLELTSRRWRGARIAAKAQLDAAHGQWSRVGDTASTPSANLYLVGSGRRHRPD